MCAHNKPEERTCEDGLVWNDDINNCDHDKGAEDPTGKKKNKIKYVNVLFIEVSMVIDNANVT